MTQHELDSAVARLPANHWERLLPADSASLKWMPQPCNCREGPGWSTGMRRMPGVSTTCRSDAGQ